MSNTTETNVQETAARASGRLSPQETAARIRKALRNAFPGQSFSLRCERGTGWGYMNLTWVDGPTTAQVEAVTDRFRSEVLSDRPDDSVVRIPNGFTCKGVLMSRRYSPDVWETARGEVFDPGEYDVNVRRYLDGKAL